MATGFFSPEELKSPEALAKSLEVFTVRQRLKQEVRNQNDETER